MQDPGDLARLKRFFADAPLPDLDERLGLLFHPALTGPSYDQTPRECVTFATTGGDGVHFSFLGENGAIDVLSPIVLTVPMARQPNRVVGRNLRHFLGLGRAAGFFVLEQLQYDFPGTVASLDNGRLRRDDPGAYAAYVEIADAMRAPAWTNHRAELQSLQERFSEAMDS